MDVLIGQVDFSADAESEAKVTGDGDIDGLEFHVKNRNRSRLIRLKEAETKENRTIEEEPEIEARHKEFSKKVKLTLVANAEATARAEGLARVTSEASTAYAVAVWIICKHGGKRQFEAQVQYGYLGLETPSANLLKELDDLQAEMKKTLDEQFNNFKNNPNNPEHEMKGIDCEKLEKDVRKILDKSLKRFIEDDKKDDQTDHPVTPKPSKK